MTLWFLTSGKQCSLAHQLLPPNEQTKPNEVWPYLCIQPALVSDLTISQDVQYLSPIIAEIEAENQERADLDEMFIPKRKQIAKSAEGSH
jgi:ubiquinol-cytochrome c reductase subunit 7